MEVLESWNDVPKEILEQINSALCCAEFKPQPGNKKMWSFSSSLSCWEYQRFLTVAQWAKIAQLCVYHGTGSIKEALKSLSFETQYFQVGETIYKIPTNVGGYIGTTYFLVELDGRAHS